MKIYTKTGDQGSTGLHGGGRVSKHHPRVAAYGDVDELNSWIGMVRATEPIDFMSQRLEEIQRDLFAIGGQLATPDPEKVKSTLAKVMVDPARVGELEQWIDEAETELPPLTRFVLPAGTAKASSLHVARTVCRRAERSIVALSTQATVPPIFLPYLNRLSDLLFVWARLANRRGGQDDVPW